MRYFEKKDRKNTFAFTSAIFFENFWVCKIFITGVKFGKKVSVHAKLNIQNTGTSVKLTGFVSYCFN